MKYKFVSSGQNVDDAAVITQTLLGTSLKPLAPVNVRGIRDDLGNLLIQWDRRSRLGPGLRPSAGTSISEESEIYLIEIFSGSTVLRTMRVNKGAQAVMWRALNQGALINGNTLNTSGTSGLAAIVQEIRGTGGFVEYTIETGSNPPVVSSLFRVYWPSALYSYSVEVQGGGSPALNVNEVVYSGASVSSVLRATTSYSNGDRVRIMNVGSELRFYKNYMAIGQQPLYVGTKAVELPLSFDATIFPAFSGTHPAIKYAFIFPEEQSTIYSAAQQVADFGSIQPTIKIRIMQISAIVGRGFYTEVTL